MGKLSSGHNGRIEAVEIAINDLEFNKMYQTHKDMLDESKDPNRKEYKLDGYNCGTRACDVISKGKSLSNLPDPPKSIPTKMIKEAQEYNTRITFDPITRITQRINPPSSDEKGEDQKRRKGRHTIKKVNF